MCLLFPLTNNNQDQQSSKCKIDTKAQAAKDESKNNLVWEYFHKSYNFQMRGEIVENMIDEIDNLKHVNHINEEEITDLKSKCEKFEQEKLNAVNDLKETQVMSNDQQENRLEF